MLKKIFSYIKEEYKYILFLIIFAFVFLFPLPYYVIAGGGTLKIDKKIKIENEYVSKGSFNFAYVREFKATCVTYLIAKIVPSFELLKESSVKEDTDNETDYENRDKILLYSSTENAKVVAFEKAGRQVKVKSIDNYIMYIAPYAETNLKVGDIIMEVDGKKINSLDDYKKIMSEKNISDKLKLKVKRKNKIIDTYANVVMHDNILMTGLYIMINKTYTTNPKITLNFSNNESGPSGGLMLALAIYDKLTKDDLTKGLKIVGTGTIDEFGNVGEIGGVIHKLRGAVKEKADIFIVPTGDNYNEVIKEVKEKNYNIKIIEAKTFDQVLNDLQNI